ncbi:MAG: hypothetical protein AAFX06_24685 [Planctomycetota bacterium]
MNRCLTRSVFLSVLLVSVSPVISHGHQPDGANTPVRQRIDLIGPIGNRLPAGHRRKFNRPRNWIGWTAYRIAPSSIEAMSWHRAQHAGAYDDPKRSKRIEYHYFYPKPWEAMRIGQRPSTSRPEDVKAETGMNGYVPSPLTIEDEETVEALTPPPAERNDEAGAEDLALPPVKDPEA